MRNRMIAPIATLALALAVPAYAGGDHCAGHAKSTKSASAASASCESKSASMAWSGAWLQRSADGAVSVAAVANGSPAAKAGLRTGDVVTAVNGYRLADADERAACASKAECAVGSNVTYTVQRGRATKSLRLKLATMPADAEARYANKQAAFEPSLAAVVIPAVH